MPRRFPLLLIAALVILAATSLSACAAKTETPAPEPEPSQIETPAESPAAQETTPAEPDANAEDVTELKIEDLTVGKGAAAENGDVVTVHYTGWLSDGTKFESSKDSGEPYEFPLGAGNVITGWDQGVVGMKVGGKRKLTIPSDLAYGPAGNPPTIPPNATLVFEIELLSVK